jgi:hypothetical protein
MRLARLFEPRSLHASLYLHARSTEDSSYTIPVLTRPARLVDDGVQHLRTSATMPCSQSPKLTSDATQRVATALKLNPTRHRRLRAMSALDRRSSLILVNAPVQVHEGGTKHV